MKIRIILLEPYPHGMACTNRVHNYAKGFCEIGGDVQIIIPKPTEADHAIARNKTLSGRYEGIHYEYTCGTTIRGNTFIKRRLLVLKGLIGATATLIKSRHHLDAVLLVSNSLGYILYFKLLTSLLGAKYLQEKSELPFVKRKKNPFLELYSHFYINCVYKCFDGILVISRYLYEYLKPKIRKNAELLLVPVIVNPDDFPISEKGSAPGTIVYCGNLSERQDGTLTLIKAFKITSGKFPHTKLYIVGDSHNKSHKEKVMRLIDGLNLYEKVILTGYMSREKLRALLSSASILALAKPSGLQADSCFPSKLGEYLATGNPVVVTKTGEIPAYLTDAKSAFLAEPDSVDSFAAKLYSALSNPELAREVGLMGRHVALRNFDYKNQAKRIMSFIDQLNQR